MRGDQDWKALCEQVVREQDPEKLNQLVEQLNRILAKQIKGVDQLDQPLEKHESTEGSSTESNAT